MSMMMSQILELVDFGFKKKHKNIGTSRLKHYFFFHSKSSLITHHRLLLSYVSLKFFSLYHVVDIKEAGHVRSWSNAILKKNGKTIRKVPMMESKNFFTENA